MWISKKRWRAMEERVAAIEKVILWQQQKIECAIKRYVEQMSKSSPPHRWK